MYIIFFILIYVYFLIYKYVKNKRIYIYIYICVYIYIYVYIMFFVMIFFLFFIVGRRNDAYLQWCCVVMDYAWQTSGFLLISRAWRCHVDHFLDRQVVMRSQKLPVRLYTVLIGYAAMIGVDAKVDLRMIEFLFLCRTSSVPR